MAVMLEATSVKIKILMTNVLDIEKLYLVKENNMSVRVLTLGCGIPGGTTCNGSKDQNLVRMDSLCRVSFMLVLLI